MMIPERKRYVAREITDDDVITPAQGRAVAKEMGAFYYETSVLVQYGIDEVGVLVQYGIDEVGVLVQYGRVGVLIQCGSCEVSDCVQIRHQVTQTELICL